VPLARVVVELVPDLGLVVEWARVLALDLEAGRLVRVWGPWFIAGKVFASG
jgi:hypothetical protein